MKAALPQPNTLYYRLTPKEAALVAFRVSKLGGNDVDWRIFKQWTTLYNQHRPVREQMDLGLE